MGVLLKALNVAEENDGSIVILGPRNHLRRTLDLGGWDSVFRIVDSREEALELFA